jgi:hypothetical protein
MVENAREWAFVSREDKPMADAGRDLISAINALATEIERGIFVAQGIAVGTIGNLEEDRDRAMLRCQQAIAVLQAGGATALPRGEISAAMRRLEGILARERRLNKAPRVCGVQ